MADWKAAIIACYLLLPLAACESEDDKLARADQAAEDARADALADYGADEDGSGADPDGVEASDIEDEGNYVCTSDCSGHEAGFAWAQDNDATEESDCGGTSQSFIEGCEAFVAQRQEEADRIAQEAAEEAADEARSAAYDE